MHALQPNSTYHIFNHANGFENVFQEDENFRYFLEKYQLYISLIAETYSYCLMPNHFHLVLRIRKREVLEGLIRSTSSSFSSNFSKVQNFGKVELIGKVEITDAVIEKYLSKQFSNLFSSYTQSFNKVYKRMGSLFIKNFKREIILDKEHFMNAIIYTHRNPIHHGFCKAYGDWAYCSYSEIMEGKSKLIEIEKIIKVFGGKKELFDLHEEYLGKFH